MNAPRIVRGCLLLGLVGCEGSTAEDVPAAPASVSAPASALPSASPTAPATAVDIYCDAIAHEWETVDSNCNAEERATADYAEARTAVTTAVDKCKALLRPSHAAGRIGFEQKPVRYVDHDCQYAGKYEWAALGPLTRLLSNCSRTRVTGLVADGSSCRHSFECKSGICAGPPDNARCRAPLEEGDDCSTVEPTHLGGPVWSVSWGAVAPCKAGLYCDRDAPPPLLAGYPLGDEFRRADFPVRAGLVSIDVVADGVAPKPDIAEWSRETRPYLIRCFEAALAKDAKAHGSVTLDLPVEGPRAVMASDAPEELRDCAVSVTNRYRKSAARVRIRFDAPSSTVPVVPRARSGKCRAVGKLNDACELASDCYDSLACTDWRCSMDGAAECISDADCWMTQRCSRGQCVARGAVGAPCKRSGDCTAGVCTAGTCRAMCASKAGPRFDPD